MGEIAQQAFYLQALEAPMKRELFRKFAQASGIFQKRSYWSESW